ncbi:AmmeMemoRadiSam system radical SAM enzyme [Candidatus Bipolaricaulota bacterium]
MREAMCYDRISKRRVHCRLCSHCCIIADGERGICQVRRNEAGTLESLVYERVIARDVDPIEKKPLFHFYPATRAYSIATVGCNFTCLHCQNHYISQYPRAHAGHIVGDRIAAREIVMDAVESGCHSIAYTYTEPTIAIEYVLEVMEAAREAGLTNVWVTNGYFTAEAAALIVPLLDAANIDLKGISEGMYHDVVGGNVRPVLDTIERLVGSGVWVEATTLIIPGINDSRDELRWTAEAIRGISPTIPWHVSRFFPAYRMVDRAPTPAETLEMAKAIGHDVGLQFVYIGNLPGEGESTHCSSCGAKVIARSGFLVKSNRLLEGVCPDCETVIPGVWFVAG